MNDFLSAFEHIRKNKLLFLKLCILDLGFSVSFLYLFWKIMYGQIFQILTKLSQVITFVPDINAELEQQAASIDALAKSMEFISLYSSLMKWLLLLIVSVFFIVIIFHGASYLLTAKFLDKKLKAWSYLWKFSVLSLVFYLLMVLSFWLTIYLSILNTKMLLPIFTQEVVNVIFIVLLVIINYFWTISLVQVRKEGILQSVKKTFNIGIFHIPRISLIGLEAFLVLAAGGVISYLLYFVYPLLFFPSLILFAIPCLSASRILLFEGIDKLK